MREIVDVVRVHIGKVITDLELRDEQFLIIAFADGTKLCLQDDNRECCEHRYMTCDDNLEYYIGTKFQGIEIRDAQEVDCDWKVHEIQFVWVHTSLGDVTVASHNEYNGYYGGICLTVGELDS